MTNPQKILVVDDTSMFRELEAIFLGRLGRVYTASGGHEALEIARREFPDVMVVDLDMPGMDGETLCRAVKADRDLCRTPVILVTTGECAQEHERAVRAHADDVLAKPLSRIQLALSASRLLRNGPRGLKRVEVETGITVRLTRDDATSQGLARDLSRGGIFIASRGQLPPTTEVQLDFRLPHTRVPLRPSAEVIWSGRYHTTGEPGMGLRFLALDRGSTEQIDAYVHEHASEHPLAASEPGGSR